MDYRSSIGTVVALLLCMISLLVNAAERELSRNGEWAVGNGEWAGFPTPCPLPTAHSPLSGLWVRAEGLVTWTDGLDMRPLVTTSVPGTPPAEAGIAGRPTTGILLGQEEMHFGAQLGGRIALGYWLCPCECSALETSYLGLGRETESFVMSSDEIPILARPIVQNGQPAAMLVAHPDFLRGDLSVVASTEFQSVDARLRQVFHQGCASRTSVLAGYRYAQLEERLRIDQFSEWTAPQGLIQAGTTRRLFDLFEAENWFHGGEIGLLHEVRLGCGSLELLAKLGVGNTHSVMRIQGATTTATPGGGAAHFVGGLLAQSTNIGRYDRNEFTVIPELGITYTLQLSCRLQATLGYSVLFWPNVARPGEGLDLHVSQFPPEPPAGARTPQFAFTDGDVWVQGLRFGFEYRF